MITRSYCFKCPNPGVTALICLFMGIQIKPFPYHPASDGLVERCNRTLLMMLAMYDLLPAVMKACHYSVHESTGFSQYRLMFREECTLPMDAGLSQRDQDLPDLIKNPYAFWVRDALEVARQFGDRNDFMISGLYGVCLLWGIGLCAITRRLRIASWNRPGLDPI